MYKTDQNTVNKNEWEISQAVDHVAYYLDNKDMNELMKHFSVDAHLKIIEGDKLVCDLNGQQAIRDVLAKRLEESDDVFHLTGTKMIKVNVPDQNATANTCCVARLVRRDPDAATTQFIEYNDRLIKVDGFWYIVERTIHIISQSIA